MKINFLKSAAFVSIMLMTACTNEMIEPTVNNELNLGQGEDVIRISLTNTTATRTARPIGTSVADNNVNRVAFKFLTNGATEDADVQLVGVIDETTGNSEEEFEKAENSNVLILPDDYNGEEICVKFNGLKEGTYKIIAYGYNYTNGTDASDEFPYTIELTQQGNNNLYKATNVTSVQEIFAGSNEGTYIGVNQHGKFQTIPKITLKRQVAGLMAYFKNAPVFVNNKKVAKITVSSKADVTGFYFPASMIEGTSLDPLYNGVNDENWSKSEYMDYLTFDMKYASNYDSDHLDSGDYYEFSNQTGKFLMAEGMTEIKDLVCQENTLFGSRFLLAFPAYNDFSVNSPECATLNICYWEENGKLILSVPLRNGGTEGDNLGAKSYQYSILCNYFYSIGGKTNLDGTDDNPINIDEPTGYDYAKINISNDWSQHIDLIN